MKQQSFDFELNIPPLMVGKTEKSAKQKSLITRGYNRELLRQSKMDTVAEVFKTLPKIGDQVHLITNGKYDLFNLIHHFVEKMGVCNEIYLSTWIFTKQYSKILIKLFDEGKIKSIGVVTGLYYKHRDVAGFNFLTKSLYERGQKYHAFKNHAKLTILNDGENYYTIEGSANLTNNPRTEQLVITNDKDLYLFNKEWIDEFFNGDKNESI